MGSISYAENTVASQLKWKAPTHLSTNDNFLKKDHIGHILIVLKKRASTIQTTDHRLQIGPYYRLQTPDNALGYQIFNILKHFI